MFQGDPVLWILGQHILDELLTEGRDSVGREELTGDRLVDGEERILREDQHVEKDAQGPNLKLRPWRVNDQKMPPIIKIYGISFKIILFSYPRKDFLPGPLGCSIQQFRRTS